MQGYLKQLVTTLANDWAGSVPPSPGMSKRLYAAASARKIHESRIPNERNPNQFKLSWNQRYIVYRDLLVFPIAP